MNIRKILLIGLMLPLLPACALKDAFTLEEVKPWERDILAQDKMQLEPDRMESYVDDHIFFSKEAATGGKGVGGGGCGCN